MDCSTEAERTDESWGGGDDGFKISKERHDNTATKKNNVNLGREFKNFSD
jgi:hypothetical protein